MLPHGLTEGPWQPCMPQTNVDCFPVPCHRWYICYPPTRHSPRSLYLPMAQHLKQFRQPGYLILADYLILTIDAGHERRHIFDAIYTLCYPWCTSCIIAAAHVFNPCENHEKLIG
ncbi:hypothetical protein BS78_05G194700 [Paspalum vaginatum]|nr:hypothetical protein BS78_05G194700 [Paspalum vaginatum]